MKFYCYKSKQIENTLEKANNMEDTDMEDAWDQVAPITQQTEHEDMSLDVNLSSEFMSYHQVREEQKQSVELEYGFNAKKKDVKKDFVINMIDDAEYQHSVQVLNKEQRRFFYHIMSCIKQRPIKAFHAFLTGGAGVGKTAVINAIYQMLLRELNKGIANNPDELKVLLGAPTGKAAFLIKGCTLHHLFNIPACQKFTYKPLKSDQLNTFQCKFRHVKVLIIDEISMVGNKMLQFVDGRLKQIMGSNSSFGGVSVIAVGDLFQLKPVFDGWIFENLAEDYGPLAVNLWRDDFKIFHLTEIMRQKDDVEYAQLLNRLRTGKHTNEDIKILKTRIIEKNVHSPEYPLNETHIFLTNANVNNHNSLVYNVSSESNKFEVNAHDVVIGDVTSAFKERILKIIPTDSIKTMGLHKKLQLAVGLQAELSTNINVEDGLANGASCIVRALSGDPFSGNHYMYIWVEFKEESIGMHYRHLYQTGLNAKWTPVPQVKKQFQVGHYKSAEVMRTQFPLRAASAKTVHRCQSDTMSAAVIDLDGRGFVHSHYVALSRLKSLNNLHLINLNEQSIKISTQVEKEMKRLKTEI